MSFSEDHYVPILFTKLGERKALGKMSESEKKLLTPLFNVHPIDWDFETDSPKKTVDDHLAKIPANIKESWGDLPAFIDASIFDEDLMNDGTHPIEWLVRSAAAKNLELVPVVSPGLSLEYLNGVKSLLTSGVSKEVCIRAEVKDWPQAGMASNTIGLLGKLGVTPSQVHLILDLRDETTNAAEAATWSALNNLDYLPDWKTLTVAATAMPSTLPPGRGVSVIERADWIHYSSIRSKRTALLRVPTFGDYAVTHPDPLSEIDPKQIQISAKLKYTSSNSWLLSRGDLYKGHGGKSKGGEAIRSVAQELTRRPEFTRSHTGPEKWIEDAAKNGRPGNTTTWVTIGTWRHLLRVLEQLPQLP